MSDVVLSAREKLARRRRLDRIERVCWALALLSLLTAAVGTVAAGTPSRFALADLICASMLLLSLLAMVTVRFAGQWLLVPTRPRAEAQLASAHEALLIVFSAFATPQLTDTITRPHLQSDGDDMASADPHSGRRVFRIVGLADDVRMSDASDSPSMPAPPPLAELSGAIHGEERRLRRDLGFFGLTAIAFSNIVGSGWLFSAMYAAQEAGPASLLAWLAAGVLVALVALVMVELGVSRPEGGGTVRWPMHSSGRLVGTVIGWATMLSVGANAAEITAIMQYAAHYIPGVYRHGSITGVGTVVAMAMAVVLMALNWFAVRMFAAFNNLLTAFKVLVPLLTVAALLAGGFHPGRLASAAHGGFAPYGYGAVLSALAGGGIVYALAGFQAPLDFSGEARDPRRTIPTSVLAGIGLALLVYLALQVAFLFSVPEHLLGHGWQGVDFTSPFGQLALILNLQWLSTLLYVDAVVSPGASAYVGVAVNARHTYALAKNGALPKLLMKVDPRSGIPRWALLLNLLVMLLFLLPFGGGWQAVVGVVGDMYLLLYIGSAVAVAVFRARPDGRLLGWVPGLRWIAPLAFVASTEFLYWSGWHELRLAIPLVVVVGGLLFFFIRPGGTGEQAATLPIRAELRYGAWVVAYLLVIGALSWLGSFDGTGHLPAPWDSLLVAALAVGFFYWAREAGIRIGPRTDAPAATADQ